MGAPGCWLLKAAFSLSATVISMVVAGHTLLLFLSDTAELFLRKKAKNRTLLYSNWAQMQPPRGQKSSL